MQRQAVLGVIFRQDLYQPAHQPAGLRQRHEGAAQLTGILQHRKLLISLCVCVGVGEGSSVGLFMLLFLHSGNLLKIKAFRLILICHKFYTHKDTVSRTGVSG